MNATATVIEPEARRSRSFVVNLCASTTPVALAPPQEPEFAAYEFFVTRRREEGRERFRLHMGFFASLAEARDRVEDLRKRYPTAWAGPAPLGNASPESAADVAPDACALDALSNVRQVLAKLDMDNPERALLTPAQQWSLLESGKLPEPHYAVQLLWSDAPVQLDVLPQPALFDVYTLYHVEGTRNGARCYGLRLGFFADVDAAKRVACYLKPDYKSVAVVPVTDAERDSASGEGEPHSLLRGSMPQPALPVVNPFLPETELLPASSDVVLDGGLAAPEPFVLTPQDVAPSAPRATEAKRVADVRTADAAPIEAGLGPRRLDPRTLEILGASALSVVEENDAKGRLNPPARSQAPEPKPDAATASAIRHMKGLARLFSRRGA